MVAPVAGTNRFAHVPARLPSQIAVPVPGGLSNPSLGPDDPARPGPTGAARRRARRSATSGSPTSSTPSPAAGPTTRSSCGCAPSSPDFWRGQSFDTWDGRVWTSSRTRADAVRPGGQPDPSSRAPHDGPARRRRPTSSCRRYYLEQPGPERDLRREPPDAGVLPRPHRVPAPRRRAPRRRPARAGHRLHRREPARSRHRRSFCARPRTRRRSPRRHRCCAYAAPPVTTDRVRDLAASVTASTPTTYDKVQALEAWMGAHTEYTLDIPPLPPGADAVDQFLFVDRSGFCEQIGTSLVVMLRVARHPGPPRGRVRPRRAQPVHRALRGPGQGRPRVGRGVLPGRRLAGLRPDRARPARGRPAAGCRQGGVAGLPRASPAGSLAAARRRPARGARPRRGGAWRRPLAAAWARWRDRRRPRPWAAEQLERLEAIGRDLGRDRLPGETAHEYAAALQRTVLRDPRLEAVADALAADAFADAHLDATERERVESLIGTLAERG